MFMKETSLDKIFNSNTEIYQNKKGYRFNSDSVILSWCIYLFLSKKDIISSLEIGSGTGIVSILLKRRGFKPFIDCVEIQKELFDLMKQNFLLNQVETSLFPYNADFRTFSKSKNTKYDLIFTNPPYFGVCDGKINKDDEKAISKHELFGNISDFFSISSKIIKKNGHFIFIFPLSRIQYALGSAFLNNFFLKDLFFFRENPNAQPSSFVAHMIFNGRNTSTKFELITLRDNNGCYSETGKEIMYG